MTKITYFCLAILLCIYMPSIATNLSDTNQAVYNADDIQILRIDFTMPNGYIRHLALGFTPNNVATDGYDYGYDAANVENFPYDLNWMIDDLRYVIQGVGAFDDSKRYPLGMFLANGGDIEITFDRLENFETPIDVYVYDALLDVYTRINDSDYTSYIDSGEHTDRFFIAFKDENASNSIAKTANLDLEDYNLQDTRLSYLSNTNELYVNTNDVAIIKNINIYNILGQNIMSLTQVNSKVIKIRMDRIKTSYGIVSIETDKGILSKKLFFN